MCIYYFYVIRLNIFVKCFERSCMLKPHLFKIKKDQTKQQNKKKKNKK